MPGAHGLMVVCDGSTRESVVILVERLRLWENIRMRLERLVVMVLSRLGRHWRLRGMFRILMLWWNWNRTCWWWWWWWSFCR